MKISTSPTGRHVASPPPQISSNRSYSYGAWASFHTHANYLRAFARLAGVGVDEEGCQFLEGVAASVHTAYPAGAQARSVIDIGGICDCLNRAWGTELILNLNRRFSGTEELLRLANSWGVVQAYYVGYGATQALVMAEGRPRPTRHPTTQKMAVDLWVSRAAPVSPWSFAVSSPADRNAASDGTLNGPGRPLDAEVHGWSTCTPETCWDLAGKALRSTRQDAVEERLSQARKDRARERPKDWRRQERERGAAGRRPRKEPIWPAKARLTPTEAAAAEAAVRPYTVLDYLFRLRIKANYEDARMFTEGPQEEHESAAVARDLIDLTSATLLAHELRVGQMIGADVLLDAADAWLKRNSPPGRPLGLATRRGFLDSGQ